MDFKKLLFFDGAMGTMLQKNGLPSGMSPELMNIEHPETVINIHSQYIDAGCDIIKTNTFGANRLKFENYKEIISAGIKNARVAAKDKKVALDIGSTGKLLKPSGELSFDEAYEIFADAIKCHDGADLILIETMSDLYEMKAAVLAAKENSSLPVFATFTINENGKLLTGADILTVVSVLEGLGVDALGLNCGFGPETMAPFLENLVASSSVPIILNPNAGLPVMKDGKVFYDLTPEMFADSMCELIKKGVHVAGGCCGTTPEYIKCMIEKTKNIVPTPITKKSTTVVTSAQKSVVLGQIPVIIGERINPTGKKLMKKALVEKDFNYILNEAVKQTEAGAHILDVNVGLPEIDEAEMMLTSIEKIQAISSLPLQIDSSDPVVIEKALRQYNGKALVNSVNGKQETMDAIFPIVKKYGGVVVGLTLDENGIPETAEKRLEIAENIINTAKKYGIDKKDIIIDTLTMTVSTDDKNAQITLDALKMIKEKLGVATVLGVSNVSFGLPKREIINSAFYSAALINGLDAGIINPCSEAMKNAYLAYKALYSMDKGFEEYIANFSENEKEKAENLLEDAIIKGLDKVAADEAEKALINQKPLDIINNILIPALNKVGDQFEKGISFLPQLLMSAEASKAAFGVINDYIASSGNVPESKGKIILATVKGDIHDIGKNIVKVVLENYGYEIIDLGKDVEIEDIISSVKENQVKLVGLSALMTTTVESMKKTISEIRNSGFSCKIMVGGAVLTEDYAKEIGADFYAKDAISAVKVAENILK